MLDYVQLLKAKRELVSVSHSYEHESLTFIHQQYYYYYPRTDNWTNTQYPCR